MNVSDKEILDFPKAVQNDFLRKRKVDRYFFISFVLLFVFILLFDICVRRHI